MTALTVAALAASNLAYSTFDAEPQFGWDAALLLLFDFVAYAFIAAPLSVATYRYVLLGERPRLAGLLAEGEIMLAFAVVTASISALVSIPLILEKTAGPAESTVSIVAYVALTLLLAAISIRLVFLQPAIAMRSVLAGPVASWLGTRGLFWPLTGAMAALVLPVVALFAVPFLAFDYTPSPAVWASFETLIEIVGILPCSAVVARFYAARLAQG